MNILQLLEITISRNASDLHMLVGYYPMIRIHGELVAVEGSQILTPQAMEESMRALMTPEQHQIFMRTLELDFSFEYQGKARFRVNFYKEMGQVAGALRMIPMTIPVLESLGLPKAVEKLLDIKQGLVLVTGPTGHGKSTTLAACINWINQKRSTHIITIEDPIEYVYPKGRSIISQREMFLDTKSWNMALKAALREDPDVVLVGEMRDLETIAAAMTIAETGHLVFGTLHTNSAAQSIDRIVDVFPEAQQPQIRLQLASTIEAIISQRLIPTITPGRALAVELLLKNPAVQTTIREAKTHQIDNIIMTSAELGMMSMESSLVNLIAAGKITTETAQTFSIRPELLAKLLAR
jgi:twitching motility protein PilT